MLSSIFDSDNLDTEQYINTRLKQFKNYKQGGANPFTSIFTKTKTNSNLDKKPKLAKAKTDSNLDKKPKLVKAKTDSNLDKKPKLVKANTDSNLDKKLTLTKAKTDFNLDKKSILANLDKKPILANLEVKFDKNIDMSDNIIKIRHELDNISEENNLLHKKLIDTIDELNKLKEEKNIQSTGLETEKKRIDDELNNIKTNLKEIIKNLEVLVI